jgi:hypothetical protein
MGRFEPECRPFIEGERGGADFDAIVVVGAAVRLEGGVWISGRIDFSTGAVDRIGVGGHSGNLADYLKLLQEYGITGVKINPFLMNLSDRGKRIIQ